MKRGLSLLLTLTALGLAAAWPQHAQAQCKECAAMELLRKQSVNAPVIDEFGVDGIHVILDHTTANDIIGIVVGVDGGYGWLDASNPILPDMTADVITQSGSEHYPKAKYRQELARLVTTISGTAGSYFTTFTLSCVKPNFDESWKIFSDVLMHPLYDPEEFSKLQEQQLTAIESRKADPESFGSFILDSIWSSGTHVGRVVQPADVQSVKIPDMQSFHQRTMARPRMTIVVVGNVTKEDITKRIHDAFGSLPDGEDIRKGFEPVMGPRKSDVVVIDRKTPTVYIEGRFLAPERSHQDFWPLRIATMILNDRLYREVRTKRNLSYAPFAGTGGSYGKYYGAVGVSTTNPDSTMHVIRRELDSIKAAGVTDKELRDTKAQYITEFYMGQETNLGVAQGLYRMQMETGDWRNLMNVIQNIDKVTAPEAKRAVDDFLHTIFWTAVGETQLVHPSEFQYP